jgi:hypothetical protein
MRTSMANADKQLTVQIAKMAQIVKTAQIIHVGVCENDPALCGDTPLPASIMLPEIRGLHYGGGCAGQMRELIVLG